MSGYQGNDRTLAPPAHEGDRPPLAVPCGQRFAAPYSPRILVRQYMRVLSRITAMAWRYRRRMAIAYLCAVFSVTFSLAIPFLVGEVIGRLVAFEDGKVVAQDVSRLTLLFVGLGLLGSRLMRGLFDFARIYVTDSLSQMVAYDIRNGVYDKLQHLSFAFHDREHTGDLMSKVTADVEAVRRFVLMGLVRSVEVGMTVLAIVFILSLSDWKLTLMCLGFVPLLVMRASLVMATMRKLWARVQELMGQSVTIFQENLSGIHVVKAFASEEHEKLKYARKAEELREVHYRSDRIQGTESAWTTLYFTLALGLIMWYGGWQVMQGNLTAGELTKFLLYVGYLTFPVRMLPFIFNAFARATTSGQRLFDVLDARSPVQESPNAEELGSVQGDVAFRDVSFSYDQRVPALRHIDMSIPKGSVVALLGAPGSGKSTIVNLIPRFYDVTSGSITIDGKDIREFTLASLRRKVGLVQQDVFLFGATIHDNIAYGSLSSGIDDVVRAAKVARLHDEIVRLPAGYDTWVEERGVTLSGGQRQRLSIARTILLDPPVLVLDDSTSSVDVETERLIHSAMAAVMQGRTTFVIAHRLSTVRDADLILVLKDGEIAEQGSHRELMAIRGLYRDIYDLQLRPQEELLLDARVVRGAPAAADGADG